MCSCMKPTSVSCAIPITLFSIWTNRKSASRSASATTASHLEVHYEGPQPAAGCCRGSGWGVGPREEGRFPREWEEYSDNGSTGVIEGRLGRKQLKCLIQKQRATDTCHTTFPSVTGCTCSDCPLRLSSIVLYYTYFKIN